MVLRVRTLLLVMGSVVLAACSSSSGGAEPTGGMSMGGASSETMTIEITALDSLRFDPAAVTVPAGEPARFVVTNPGSTTHEFVVGDEDMQMSHEQEMTSGSMSPSMSMEMVADTDMRMPALILAPGETKEATVTFDGPGTFLYGCHEPGHYAGGMVGTITVE